MSSGVFGIYLFRLPSYALNLLIDYSPECIIATQKINQSGRIIFESIEENLKPHFYNRSAKNAHFLCGL
ncbi:MAG TPA: hypothetical protein DCW46_09105 [Desulfotomaculum sp.]|nr:hypothetical protein [Desulfotomaculum sp.]